MSPPETRNSFQEPLDSFRFRSKNAYILFLFGSFKHIRAIASKFPTKCSVDLLLNGPLPVGEIAEKLELNQPQASKHLRVLCGAGLVQVQPAANRRIYSLRPEPLQELDQWLDSYRRMWKERFDRLDDYLNAL